VVYVGGKVAKPNIKELNVTLNQLQKLEEDFVQKVRTNWQSNPPVPPAVRNLSDAKGKESIAYETYKKLAETTAITFESFFNTPVAKEEREPRLPT